MEMKALQIFGFKWHFITTSSFGCISYIFVFISLVTSYNCSKQIHTQYYMHVYLHKMDTYLLRRAYEIQISFWFSYAMGEKFIFNF